MTGWLASPQQLAELAEKLDGRPVALDTEFIRERTYFPQLALVQLSQGDGEALIDPVALPQPGPLASMLQGPTLKLMHSPSEDLQAFRHGWGVLVEPIFDTQLAAALCGLGAGIGYQALVEKLLGVHLEKGETRSDWLRRPLSESQCHYAAEDVRHLHALHADLDARLRALGRRDWLAQDCARMIDAVRSEVPDPNPHLSMRSAQRLPADGQARVRRLLLWRDVAARRSDRPKGWILDNELVVLLAQRVPATRAEFDARLDAHPKAPKKQRGEIWDLLSAPLTAEERDLPLALESDPAWRGPLKQMQAAVAERAAALDLPDGLLCARRHLETLLGTRQWPAALEGWRQPLLQEPLMRLLPAA